MSTTADPWAAAFGAANVGAPTPAADPWAPVFAQQPSSPAPQEEDPWAAAFGAAQSAASSQAPKPEEAQASVGGNLWKDLNSPLVDFARPGAGPIEKGVENFISGLTTPGSLALAVATFGSGAVEEGLVRAGVLGAADAAGVVQKAKLAADFGFLTKYGYDLGSNTLPQLELNWGDYRAAKTAADKKRALDRLEQFGTESVLNAVASGLAVRGVSHDVADITAASPRGRAVANELYAEAIHNFSEENQVGTAQARQDFEHYRKIVPDEKRRVAIARNIEAGGDPALLEQWAQEAESNPAISETAKELRAAKQLSPEEIDVRDAIRNMLAGDLAHLKYHNLLPEDGGLPNYLPHKWDVEDKDPDAGKTIERTLTDGDRDMLKKRIFSSIHEGEMRGAKPTTKDAVALIGDYHERVSNLIAKNNLAQKLAGSYMNEGSPMAAPGHLFPGFTRPKDAPVSPAEVENLKAAGKFDALLRSGRIYEVEPRPEKAPGVEGEPGLIVAPKPLAKYDAREIPGEQEQHAYMWKQRDYVPSGLSIWRPVSEAEAKAYPNSVVVFGDGPFPEQAIVPYGEQREGMAAGIPTEGAERVAMARVPVYVHPDIAVHLEPMLEARTPKSTLVRAFLAVSKETKSDLLSLSPFHWATILNRSLEAGLNPFGGTNRKFIFVPKEIDYYNLTEAQQRAIHSGVVVSSTRPGYSGYLEEGLGAESDSIINRIPLVGNLNRAIEGRLFGPHGWITSLKFDLFDKLSAEMRKSRPELSPEQADRIAAAQVNNKFGGLNYTVMGRGASTQNTLRSLLLAPDFLESTGRSILDVAGGSGRALLSRLVAFNAAHWLLARGINYLVSGNTHPEAGFSVLSKNGKREYSLRTTLGDFLHFAEKPRDFLANRVNPIGVRAPAEIAAGEDEFGNKVTNWQQFFDTLRQVTPIPLQGIFPEQTISQPSATDKMLQSVGVQSRKKFTPAEMLAHQLSSKHGEGGETLEGDELADAQLRYRLEDSLRTAINMKDNAGRIDAIHQIHKASLGDNPKISPAEASRMIAEANKYPMPIQSAVAHLDLADALDVWDKASIIERRALRPILENKIERWSGDARGHTRRQNQTMREKIQRFRSSLSE